MKEFENTILVGSIGHLNLDMLREKTCITLAKNIAPKALREIAKALGIKNTKTKISLEPYNKEIILKEKETGKAILKFTEDTFESYFNGHEVFSLKRLLDPVSLIESIKAGEKVDLDREPVFRITLLLTVYYSRRHPQLAYMEHIEDLLKVVYVDIPLGEKLAFFEPNKEHLELLYKYLAGPVLYMQYGKEKNKYILEKAKAMLYILENKEKIKEEIKNEIAKKQKPIIEKLSEKALFFDETSIVNYINKKVLNDMAIENYISTKPEEKIIEISGEVETKDYYNPDGIKKPGSYFYHLYPVGIVMMTPKIANKIKNKKMKEKQVALF